MGTLHKSIDEIARKLAKAHREQDASTVAIYLVPSDAEIRLIEVTPEVGNTGEILPYGFAPDIAGGVPFPSCVVLLSPEEWESVKTGDIPLPPGWGSKEQIRPLYEAS